VWRSELEVLLPEFGDGQLQHGPGAATSTDPAAGGGSSMPSSTLRPNSSGPLLLVIDDLQWCETDAMLIGFLISSHPTSPNLVAGTVRTDEITAGRPLAKHKAKPRHSCESCAVLAAVLPRRFPAFHGRTDGLSSVQPGSPGSTFVAALAA
jgi:hypothetical protein